MWLCRFIVCFCTVLSGVLLVRLFSASAWCSRQTPGGYWMCATCLCFSAWISGCGGNRCVPHAASMCPCWSLCTGLHPAPKSRNTPRISTLHLHEWPLKPAPHLHPSVHWDQAGTLRFSRLLHVADIMWFCSGWLFLSFTQNKTILWVTLDSLLSFFLKVISCNSPSHRCCLILFYSSLQRTPMLHPKISCVCPLSWLIFLWPVYLP